MARTRIAKSDFILLAALRQALRRFLGFSREAARGAGITPQQHQALLAVKGFSGRDYVSVGELARSLQVRHNSAVGLADRLVRHGLLRRTRSRTDARRAELRLTAKGETAIEGLATAHLRELRQLGPELLRLISSITDL